MLRRLIQIGRNFVSRPTPAVSERTIEMLNDPGRDFEKCINCRFRSTMVDRCMRIEGAYYRRPVTDDHVCDLFEPIPELDIDKQSSLRKLMLIEPRGGRTPVGLLARKMELSEFATNNPVRRCDCQGCITCHYNPDRVNGVGYEGCRFPGEVYDINPIDGGKFCKSWVLAKD